MSGGPIHHSKPCLTCRAPTYTKSGLCRHCAPTRNGGAGPAAFPLPSICPEEYLIACAQELAARHRVRAETLARIGIIVTPKLEEAA